jgi:hypothetical protein
VGCQYATGEELFYESTKSIPQHRTEEALGSTGTTPQERVNGSKPKAMFFFIFDVIFLADCDS